MLAISRDSRRRRRAVLLRRRLCHEQAAPPSRTTLHGSAPAWARQGNFVRPADPAGPVGFRVYLGWKSGAEAFATAVSDPSSPSYGKYVSASEFRRRFAPSEGQVGAVRSWLKDQGLSIDLHADEQPLHRGRRNRRAGRGCLRNAVQHVLGQRDDRSVARRATLRSRMRSRGRRHRRRRARRQRRVRPDVSRHRQERASDRGLPERAAALGLLGAAASRRTRIRPASRDVASPATRTVDGQGVHAGADQGRVRDHRAGERRGPDGRDHRRVRVADDPAGRQPVVDQPRAADDERVAVHAGRAAWHLQQAREPAAGSAGLVRRGDARHRGGARHGARARRSSTSARRTTARTSTRR